MLVHDTCGQSGYVVGEVESGTIHVHGDLMIMPDKVHFNTIKFKL